MNPGSKFKVQSSKLKIKRGDLVVVITGKARGKTGTIEQVRPKKGTVVVSGINKFKKRLRKSREHPTGGTVERFRAIDASNVKVICPHCNKPTRIGYTFEGSRKVRICKRCKANLDKKS